MQVADVFFIVRLASLTRLELSGRAVSGGLDQMVRANGASLVLFVREHKGKETRRTVRAMRCGLGCNLLMRARFG